MNTLPEQIETCIRLAARSTGDAAGLRERERAAQFLINHPAEAYPPLARLVDEKPAAWETPRLLDIIGRMGLPESAPLLADLLAQAIPDTSRAAGRALGAVGGATAQTALLAGLTAPNNEVRIAALEGARIFGGDFGCAPITPMLTDADANVRYYAVSTAVSLGCLAPDQLAQIAREDSDAYVRLLAEKAAQANT